MKNGKNELERLNFIIRDKGYKLTPQRVAILNGIIEKEGEHLTIEELFEVVKKDNPEIGIATIYRTVMLFEKINIIAKVDLGDGCYRYELVHVEEDHYHHHLICKNCNKVIEVVGDLLENLEDKIEKKYEFKIENHSLKFFGVCKNCRNKSDLSKEK